VPFLVFPPAFRRVIYANAIESLNYQLRKVTKNRGQLPQRASRGEVAVAGDLQHRRQASP
jgi:transposase-like protein